ncbi:MAG: histidinol-phosphate transaminase [Buchnera aphidicola (Periphyllus lyropictus)]|uniref:histidinol-phosphate transaminase n=1 Tax=Buchnera aphidicola TaxID=9 RepID=UPI001ED0EB1A|nr:histidinol-phosphate transaminase [Buchnera aphidicola]NIH16731.1 histidinol-phosphate transaminase [Buchnera aphidicola (Periphyllus lyropictus)]USS94633.1 histidinol-phosphate transaminase [Buchnera aphidicola (Periphyllus lyropictus)]
MIDIKKLVRKNIRNLIPYQSARSIKSNGDIWLNANEMPFPKKNTFFFKNLNRYPRDEYSLLIRSYASYLNINKINILATRGSDEAIELLIKAFCEPKKDKIMFFPPTYDMYSIYSEILGIESVKVFQLKKFKLDINTIKKNMNNIKIIFICNPNNPTGTIIKKKDIIKILKISHNKCLVVVDEAYIEFCIKKTSIDILKKYSNLVILRTLSKAFSLASIRCGFVISNYKIINVLKKIIAPYPLATPVLKIALNAFSHSNLDYMKYKILKLYRNKNFLINKLKKNFHVKKIFPSYTNFLLVKFHSSKDVFNLFLKKKIISRDQSNKVFLKNCIRISIGTKKECLSLLNSLVSKKKDIN